MPEGGIHADHLRVRLRVDEAREAVAGVAADAAALPRVLLVEHDADGHVERPVPDARQVVDQLLDARLVAEGWMEVGRARGRLRRIAAAEPVHLVEVLGLRVVRLQVVVRARPGGRDAAVVGDLAEVLPAEPDQPRAVELGVPANEVVRAGVELLAVAVVPGLLDVVAVLDLDGARVPVLLLARDVAAPREEEDALARGREAIGERPAPRAGPDDDHVVVIVRHGPFPQVVAREGAPIGARSAARCCQPRATSRSSDSGPAPFVPSQTSRAMYANSVKPTRLPMPSTCSQSAVRIATHMVTISGTAAKRVAKPSSKRPPHTNSVVEARRAWKAGAARPSSVKALVTFPRSWSLPQPDWRDNSPTVPRAGPGDSHCRAVPMRSASPARPASSSST